VASPSDKRVVIFTIGHSTRTIEDFIELVKQHEIKMVVDVRTIPKSRHNPQFNRDTLTDSFAKAGLGYMHIAGLGGLRHTHAGSPNMGWRNTSFRGFADYMQTEEFRIALEQLIVVARHQTVAIMCAEALPWRCHRSLIADALLIRNIEVKEIIGLDNVRVHALTPWARVNGKEVTYPAKTGSEQTVTLSKDRVTGRKRKSTR
jgi:uncharacterized protein (DUF488 family)